MSMTTRLHRWLLASALLAVCLPDTAAAQSPSGEGPPDESSDSEETPVDDGEARSLFEAGQAAFSDGRFEDALARWQQSYELTQHPELLYNIATSLDRLGRLAEARERYTAFLEAMPDASNRNYVRRRVDVIDEQLAGNEPDASEAPPPGTDGAPGVLADPVETPSVNEPSRVGPAILFGLAGAALVGGIVTAVLAEGQYGDLDDACPNGVCGEASRGDIDTLTALTVSADMLFGVAALSAVGGLLWWLLDTGDADVEASAMCGFGGCAGSVRGRF